MARPEGLRLVTARDAHFAWMLGEAPAPEALRLPPGGMDQRWVLEWLRRTLPRVAGRSWLIVAAGEVVGLCSHKNPPTAEGVADIGYGVAPERRRLGYATCAVAMIAEAARADPAIAALTAETALANLASQRVVEANGFTKVGRSHDRDEGEMIVWRLETG